MQFYEFVNGNWRTRVETGPGILPLRTNTDYWLRATAGESPAGANILTVSWSQDGTTYSPIFVSGPLANLSGQVGLRTQGQNLPDVLFDDFDVSGACS